MDLIVNYRDPNSQITFDEYPLPLARTAMELLPRAKIFKKINVHAGYNNLHLRPDASPKPPPQRCSNSSRKRSCALALPLPPRTSSTRWSCPTAACSASHTWTISPLQSEEEHVRHVSTTLEAIEAHSLRLKPGK